MIKIFLQFDISCSSKLKKYLGHVLLHYDTHTDGTDHLEYIYLDVMMQGFLLLSMRVFPSEFPT